MLYLPSTFVHIFAAGLEAEREFNLSDIPPSRFLDAGSSIWTDFSHIQMKCGAYSIEFPYSAPNVLELVLGWLNSLGNRLKLVLSI